MINSRCPGPSGTIGSIALRPVCSGSFTGCRSTTPGAIRSTGEWCSVTIGPRSSMGLQWLFHRLPVDYAGRDSLNRRVVLGNDWTTVVDGIAEHVDHASDERVADRNFHDASGALYEIAFTNRLKLAEQHRTDLVFFEV